MNHFVVLVVGDNVEEQLLPFDENKHMEPYVEYTKEQLIAKGKREIEDYKNGDTYQEFLKDPEKYELILVEKHDKAKEGHLNFLRNDFPKMLKWTDEQIYQNELKWYNTDQIGENGEVYSTYNPNSKWNWYQISGRWCGELKLIEIPLLESILGFTIAELSNLHRMDPMKAEEVISKYNDKEVDIRKALEKYGEKIYPEHSLGEESDYKLPPGYCDITKKKFVDVAGMEEPKRKAAAKAWTEWHSKIKHLPENSNEKKIWINDTMGFFVTKESMEHLNNMTLEEYKACMSV